MKEIWQNTIASSLTGCRTTGNTATDWTATERCLVRTSSFSCCWRRWWTRRLRLAKGKSKPLCAGLKTVTTATCCRAISATWSESAGNETDSRHFFRQSHDKTKWISTMHGRFDERQRISMIPVSKNSRHYYITVVSRKERANRETTLLVEGY